MDFSIQTRFSNTVIEFSGCDNQILDFSIRIGNNSNT